MQKQPQEEIDYIEDINPEEIYKYCEEIHPGDILEGKVLQISPEGVYVDIGSKLDGFIPLTEFGNKDITKILKPAEVVKVYVVKLNYNNTHLVSYKKAKEIELKSYLEQCFKEQTPIDAKIVSLTNFGAVVDIGLDAVLPYREMTKDLKSKLSSKKTDIEVKVVIKEIKQKRDGIEIVVSQKIYEEKVRKELIEKIFANIKEGDIIVGSVKTITDFGAFLDIGGVDALLHISDIAWYRVEKIEDILKIGNKIKVKVLKIDRENEKISVGLKQLFPHPWDKIEEKYHVGEIVKGKIVNITKFGLFVELEPAVEGLVHISEIDWKEKNPKLEKMFSLGQEIHVKILEINKEEKKVVLSYKKTFPNPWEELKQSYPPGTKLKGKIVKITPYGIFVTIQSGFEGMVHISDISWYKETKNVLNSYKIGQEIEYVVLDIIPEEERAVLSIKHLLPNPYQKYTVGTIVCCMIKKILSNFLIVSLEQNIEGIIRKKEAVVDNRDAAKPLNQLYKVGQKIDAVVIYSDELTHKIELSVKKLEYEIQKQLIKKFSTIEPPTLKDILQEE